MHTLMAVDLQQKFLNGELSASSIVRHFLQRIEKYDGDVGAFLEVFTKKAFLQAELIDEKKMKGLPLGKLAGIPIALKDNIHVRGEKLTCASKFMESYVSSYDATVTKLIIEADGIILGRTNMDEFAMGASTETSAFKKTYNPWSLTCSPGGSSGGSAAAVAACFVPIALGSDTGGSIRQPSAFCGVTGFKPSYGRVSRYGLVPLASSFDQIGPIAKSVEDVSLIMEVLGKHCGKDSTSLKIPKYRPLEKELSFLKDKKIGVPWQFLEGLSTENKQIFTNTLDDLSLLGAKIVNIDLSILKHSMALYYILASAEGSTNLARFDGISCGKRSENALSVEEVYELSRQAGFGYEVKRRILFGMYVLFSKNENSYYKKALQVRSLVIEHFAKAFLKCSLIAMPTTPTDAFGAGSILNPVEMALADIYTIGANIAGLPAVSVPCGLTTDNKPFGFQILGPMKQDSDVLSAAYALQSSRKLAIQLPEMAQFL